MITRAYETQKERRGKRSGSATRCRECGAELLAVDGYAVCSMGCGKLLDNPGGLRMIEIRSVREFRRIT